MNARFSNKTCRRLHGCPGIFSSQERNREGKGKGSGEREDGRRASEIEWERASGRGKWDRRERGKERKEGSEGETGSEREKERNEGESVPFCPSSVVRRFELVTVGAARMSARTASTCRWKTAMRSEELGSSSSTRPPCVPSHISELLCSSILVTAQALCVNDSSRSLQPKISYRFFSAASAVQCLASIQLDSTQLA